MLAAHVRAELDADAVVVVHDAAGVECRVHAVIPDAVVQRERVGPAVRQLKALRANGIQVVAIHHHMTGVKPAVIFLHYYGTGPAAKLAQGVRSAVDLLGNAPANRQ